MIAFVSLFLGLITDTQTVELGVSGSVAAVEIRLDGETVGVLDQAPWKLEVDFGEALRGHRLTAIARDERGVPVDQATQLINVPRPAVETELLLDGWSEGIPQRGRLIWHSVEKIQPNTVHLSLDGRPLSLAAGGHFELPSMASDRLHFLNAEVELPDGTVSSAEAIFGGVFGSTVRTELTAVPLVGGRIDPESLGGWLESGGKALEVVASEEAPALVVVVRQEQAMDAFDDVIRELRGNAVRREKLAYVGLEEEDQIRFLLPRTKAVAHDHLSYGLFPVSEPFDSRSGPLLGLIWAVAFEDGGFGPELLTDGVAVAGLTSAASRRRRAVVLVVSDCNEVSGRRGAENVRAFLSEIHVPLHVWSLEPVAKQNADQGFCANAEEISSGNRLMRALGRLKKTLEKQRIVWVDGRYLPREIELTEKAGQVRLAG